MTTLRIPLVCENLSSMNREEYLELLCGLVYETARMLHSEERLVFIPGEGVSVDTSFEECISHPEFHFDLFEGSSNDINDFLESHDTSPFFVLSNSKGNFAFTPGVIDEKHLEQYCLAFERVNDISDLTKERSENTVAPYFVTSISDVVLRDKDTFENAVTIIVLTFITSTESLPKEDLELWLDEGSCIEFFLTEDEPPMDGGVATKSTLNAPHNFIISFRKEISHEK